MSSILGIIIAHLTDSSYVKVVNPLPISDTFSGSSRCPNPKSKTPLPGGEWAVAVGKHRIHLLLLAPEPRGVAAYPAGDTPLLLLLHYSQASS